MPDVTVNSDDLEALLFATGGIKDLESALDQRKRNPMVISGVGRLAGAHDRLSAAWRRAKRDVDWPKKVVTESEIALLRSMFTAADGTIKRYIILKDYPAHFAQDLMLVEAGPCWSGFRIEWPAPAEPEFVHETIRKISYAVRLSHYGRQVLGVSESDRAIQAALSQPDGSVLRLT